MKEPTLVVLAAGMGSRYGGLKQMDPGVIENALAVFLGIFVMSALFFLML